MKEVNIGRFTMKVPIIQGGMGVGISLGNLAGNVALNGGMGVISTAQPGFDEPDFLKNTQEANMRALRREIAKAKKIAKGIGIVAINAMVALEDYEEYIKTAVAAKIDAIISGAGLPLSLPQFTKGSDVLIAPIVSSAKAIKLICRSWDRKHQVSPDFVVIEGPKAGGHLGFKKEEVSNHTYQNLEEILPEVKAVVTQYEQKYQKNIPVFVAGGIYTHQDIQKFLKLGADGVQMGTRFIATEECDASDSYKQAFIAAKEEDVQLVVSPVGLPGRAVRTPFTDRLKKEGRIKVTRCYNCLIPCNPATTPYCITDALIAACKGDLENGLVFSGSNGYRIDKIVSVKELIQELIGENK